MRSALSGCPAEKSGTINVLVGPVDDRLLLALAAAHPSEIGL
jgi:hypothetical protein